MNYQTGQHSKPYILIVILLTISIVSCSTDKSPETPTIRIESTTSDNAGQIFTPSDTPIIDQLPPNSYMPDIQRISVSELKKKIDSGTNIGIIDSRDQKYYDKSHITGAISLPMGSMSEPYTELDVYDEITTYCT